MAKNKKFANQYLIDIKGITTNESASQFLEDTLKIMVQALDQHYKQVSVNITKV